MYLFELATGDIDSELEQVANNVANAGTAQQPMGQPGAGLGGPEMGGMAAQPQMPGEFPTNQPDMPGLDAAGMEPEDEERFTKKVDSYLIARTRGMDYVTSYNHRESAPTHPFRLLQLEVDELTDARNKIRVKLGMMNMENVPGASYDDRGAGVYLQRMLAFVDRAIQLKKETGKAGRDKSQGRTGEFKQREQSKNEKKKRK